MMELEHSFTVPVPPERAWDVLLDVQRVAPCMPGASLDSVDGDDIKGRIKVKVGPISMTYAGTAHFGERDTEAGVIVLEASGKETRGAGTASATVRSQLQGENGHTKVVVHTSLNVTGRPAQFGRGVMAEVGGKLIGIFADNLAAMLAADGDAGGAGSAGSAAGPAPPRRRPPPWCQKSPRPAAGELEIRGARAAQRRAGPADRGPEPAGAVLQQPAPGGHPHASATWPSAPRSSCWRSATSAPPRLRRSSRSWPGITCRWPGPASTAPRWRAARTHPAPRPRPPTSPPAAAAGQAAGPGTTVPAMPIPAGVNGGRTAAPHPPPPRRPRPTSTCSRSPARPCSSAPHRSSSA